MNGGFGSILMAAKGGSWIARRTISDVFGDDFQEWGGWVEMLLNLRGGLLNRRGHLWTRQGFQALYVACWIHHPVEKGSYMIQLDQNQYANAREAYDHLLSNGALQARISSHLSGHGASAHEGWNFLKGYGELLIQIEGDQRTGHYLFLKCEGHALESGLSWSTVMHLASWAKKSVTGSGATASPELNELATKAPTLVEGRAAENFGNSYKKLMKQLGLSGKMVTVADVVEKLHEKAGFNHGLPDVIKNDTQLLGQSMLGSGGYIALFKRQADVLKKKNVDFDEKAEKELKTIAERMAASSPHTQQHYNEVRVTPLEVNTSLQQFYTYLV